MKLLVVVNKLLTGFDAPPCTYLYIDQSMQDHGLFQAICRTNRLDGEDKDFGFVVDYKNLFKKVENAIAVYASELDHSAGGADPEILLKDRLESGRERLDDAIEALVSLCEPVQPPAGELEHLHYFCGNSEIAEDLAEREALRMVLYRETASLVRAYANIVDELAQAGYGESDVARIKQQVKHFVDVREIVRKAAGEYLDLKPFEADMRHLIDTYIEAEEPRKISNFENLGLLALIVKSGIAEAIAAELGAVKGDKNAIAETIENNVRSTIVKEELKDPIYFARMSALLDEIIVARKARAMEYEEFLRQIAELARKVVDGHDGDTPDALKTSASLRALYNNLKASPSRAASAADVRDEHGAYGAERDEVLALALRIDAALRRDVPNGWRGVQTREQEVKRVLYTLLGDVGEVERLFLVIKAQNDY